MSDGNFNRSLLPHGSFATGVRVGRAAERAVCVEAFAKLLDDLCGSLTEEEKTEHIKHFKAMVLEKEKL